MGLQIFLLCTKQIYSWKILHKVKTRISNLSSLPTSILVENVVMRREKGTDAGWMSVCQALGLAHWCLPPSPWERGLIYFILKRRNGLREVHITCPKLNRKWQGKAEPRQKNKGRCLVLSALSCLPLGMAVEEEREESPAVLAAGVRLPRGAGGWPPTWAQVPGRRPPASLLPLITAYDSLDYLCHTSFFTILWLLLDLFS